MKAQELHPRKDFNYNKLTFKQIERLEKQHLNRLNPITLNKIKL